MGFGGATNGGDLSLGCRGWSAADVGEEKMMGILSRRQQRMADMTTNMVAIPQELTEMFFASI